MVAEALSAPAYILQDAPRIYGCVLPGQWLLKRTTPSWRIDDPDQGFQRVVREERAREIALAVLDQHRAFPNAIVLATDKPEFPLDNCHLLIPARSKFLVVDGQHRLWAQKYSAYEAPYACVIHMGLSEIDMARLFIEINNNQRRVPASLRWDLVRLIRPEDDPQAIGAADLIYQLATDEASPLFQRIDLTGEQPELQLKQGSLAPELRQLLGKRAALGQFTFDQHYRILVQYFIAIRSLAPDKWGKPDYDIYKARVLRAFLRLLADLYRAIGKDPERVSSRDFSAYLRRIDTEALSPEAIRAAQGNAGIKAIYDQVRAQALP